MSDALVIGGLGLWAMGAVAAAPFAWGWNDFWGWDDPDTGPTFRFDALCAALFWPILPLAALAGLAVVFVSIGLPYHLGRLWSADWSRPRSRHHGPAAAGVDRP